MIQLPEEILTGFFRDPVMAASVLLGWELDHFQAAALRLDWFYPNTIDDSAVGTGKTLRIFLLSCLRAILIPDQRVVVYFPNFQVAKEEFWPYFEVTIGKSNFFAQQLRPHHGKLGEQKMPGAWLMNFMNRSVISVPAPGHANDGANQAGRSMNTLIVDDWRRCEEKGDAIAKQLVDRVRRPCWNQEHPIWGNHMHFKGHAEGPSHKSHRRVKVFKKQIREGSTRHAIYSFCYRDISRPWAKRIRQYRTIMEQRRNLPHDRRMCQLLGIGAASGSSFYPWEVLAKGCRAWVEPLIRRQTEDEIFVASFDAAPGASAKADSCAVFVNRLRKVEVSKAYHEPKPGEPVVTFSHPEFGDWEICSVFAYEFKGKSAPEVSGFIHWLNGKFGFAVIVLDPGGGGFWIYKELRKTEQAHNGLAFRVIPFTDANEPYEEGDKLPIVHWFKRNSRIGDLSCVHDTVKASENGFIYAFHLRYQEAWYGGHIAYPKRMEDRPANAKDAWDADKIVAQNCLERGLDQLTKIYQKTDAEGRAVTSKGTGFPMFAAVGKKDIAYAGMYAFAGCLFYIENNAGRESGDEDAVFSIC